jgi:hypothetical protein
MKAKTQFTVDVWGMLAANNESVTAIHDGHMYSVSTFGSLAAGATVSYYFLPSSTEFPRHLHIRPDDAVCVGGFAKIEFIRYAITGLYTLATNGWTIPKNMNDGYAELDSFAAVSVAGSAGPTVEQVLYTYSSNSRNSGNIEWITGSHGMHKLMLTNMSTSTAAFGWNIYLAK